MKRTFFTAIIMFVLAAMLSSCAKWKVEIRNPEEQTQDLSSGIEIQQEKTENSEQEEQTENPSSEPEVPEEEPAEEPKAEVFSEITIYSDDIRRIKYEFTEEELSEWISIIRPEEWKEDSAEKEGGHLSDGCIVLSAPGAAMYIGYDNYGDEIALIKYGKDKSISKSYIMPEGTFAAAKLFEEKTIRENPNIFTYPECNYDMSAKAFLNRENDDYILYLADFLNCMRWNVLVAETGKEYEGFSASSELDGRVMFNQFMFVFDNGFTENGSLTQMAWYSYADEKYHIPMADIHTVLGKYFADYSFELEDHINYEEEFDSVVILNGYPVSSFRGETEVVSVTDNGDGTLTAVLESRLYHLDENDNMVLSENPEERSTIVFCPEAFRCLILSHKIESIGE